MSRSLYARAVDPESSFSGREFGGAVRAQLELVNAPQPHSLAGLEHRAAAWAAAEAARYRRLAADAGADDTRQVLVRRAALCSAPLSLISGAWLQWLTCPGNADDPAALRILTLYAADVGVGQPDASRGAACLALLRRLQLARHAVPVGRLALDPRIADWSFDLAAILLTMSRLPDDFAPEILGADFCMRVTGLPPPLTLVRDLHPAATDWTALDPGSARDGGIVSKRLSEAAIEALISGGGADTARRVALGFAWASEALRDWSNQLYADLDSARDPVVEMTEFLRLRAREGSAYHRDFELARRPLSQWLTESRTDPRGLLEALAQSRLVKPGQSGASPLVTELVGERGPMFRVFAPEDLAVIRRWIDSLGGAGARVMHQAAGTGAGHETARPADAAAPDRRVLPVTVLPGPVLAAEDQLSGEDQASYPLRTAYHLLLGRADTAALRYFAQGYVQNWLARARCGIDEGEAVMPDRWRPTGLRPWLADQHDQHDRAFADASDQPIPGREKLIDSTVQLAPLTLIDGSWLQGYTDYSYASSAVGHFLFETYWDELGNGEPRLNHPLIYRQVLAEMNISLPPTVSPEFAHWPGFRDRSFELPVYWLSIGRFPVTFMPEVLGLNLAMELSGVGGTYRRAHIALKKHGFSTRFVDIHNTIDNVTAGHSAWAADAIDTYMAEMTSSQGINARPDLWLRVRTGFRSLDPPGGWRARRAGLRAQRSGQRRRATGVPQKLGRTEPGTKRERRE